jgi:hypothetical protein
VLGLAVGLLVGGALALVGSSSRVDEGEPEVGAALPSASRWWRQADCSAIENEIDQLRAEIELALWTMDDVRVRVEGTPISWSHVRREHFRPEAFAAAMAEAELACPDVDVLHVDCDEPPCMAWVQPPATNMWDARARVHADTALLRCQEWGRVYGGTEGGYVDVDCDGTMVHGVVWGTPTGWTFDTMDPEFEANVAKRLRARTKIAQERWPCPEPEAG